VDSIAVGPANRNIVFPIDVKGARQIVSSVREQNRVAVLKIAHRGLQLALGRNIHDARPCNRQLRRVARRSAECRNLRCEHGTRYELPNHLRAEIAIQLQPCPVHRRIQLAEAVGARSFTLTISLGRHNRIRGPHVPVPRQTIAVIPLTS